MMALLWRKLSSLLMAGGAELVPDPATGESFRFLDPSFNIHFARTVRNLAVAGR
jgi:hypothetical protein